MVFQTRLEQKLSQSLVMTPQLQQAIRLLLLSRVDFVGALEAELVENPLLEKVKSQEDTDSKADNSAEIEDPWEGYLDRFTDPHGVAPSKSSKPFEGTNNIFEELLSSPVTLEQELANQIRIINPDCPQVKTALAFLVGNLDRRGYLQSSLDEIARDAGVEIRSAAKAHEILLSLDPSGVGARDLRECLLIQLKRQSRVKSLEFEIVNNFLEFIEKRKFNLIAKRLKVSIEAISEAIGRINQLEPFPAKDFEQSETKYIVPDVYIVKVGNDYQVALNEDGIPKLQVSNYYKKLLKDSSNGKGNSEYLESKLKSANWLLKSIEQRQQTIYKVANSLIKFQYDFFENGIEHLKPLVLKEVADDIEMHESTVSRITSNKYAHTPQGILELKFFFTAGISTSYGDVSSSAIKAKIKSIIQLEKATKPVSDQKIVEILNSEGIEIARRTVAKYRESLKIPPSSRRKRIF